MLFICSSENGGPVDCRTVTLTCAVKNVPDLSHNAKHAEWKPAGRKSILFSFIELRTVGAVP